MIPKIIHCCWFGGKPLTKEIQKYIETWKKFCPDYKLCIWTESNFDINQNQYCKEAYIAKKWAFVSDYVRLKVLYDYGGIYLDTDIELVKGLNPFITYDCFFGFEAEDRISTGVIGGCKHNQCIKVLLDEYLDRQFISTDGKLDTTTNVELVTKKLFEIYKIELNNKFQIFCGNCALFPFEFFCAKDLMDGQIKATEETCAIHHFNASWVPWYGKLKHRIKLILVYFFGKKFVMKLKHVIKMRNK